MRKVHIQFKDRSLCGRKAKRYAEPGKQFAEYPEAERCKSCERAKRR
jgi:hypothetical protein